jgi:LPS sulfotransferase NodH
MHHDELDDAAWDRPRGGSPRRRVMICSTPRSGSYLLCRQMINAGLGLPTEYLRPRTMTALSARFGAGDEAGYADALEAHRTTANGVFAAKLQWVQFLVHPAARERWLERADLNVFLYRDDLLAQAVSWQVSLATGLWSFDAKRGQHAADVTLDAEGYALGLVAELERQNLGWRDLLAQVGRRVLSIRYEDYVGRQGAALRAIADALGLADDDWSMPPPEADERHWPADVEAARARLLARAREAAPASAAP